MLLRKQVLGWLNNVKPKLDDEVMRLLSLLFLMLTWPLQALASGDDKEINCLALNIYFEARSETHEGQLAVGYVTMNRVVSERFPDSVCGVVWQRKQFSWTHDGKSDRPREKKAWRKAQSIAQYVYSNYHRFMDLTRGATDITRGALHYYAPKMADPVWAREMITVAQIGGHVFLVEDS